MSNNKNDTITAVQKLLKELQEQCDGQEELLAPVKRAADEVSRSLSRFASSLKIFVTMGMLKAGKSTLVNLLARQQSASPIGYGVDTTLRPVLIRPTKCNEGTICIYRKKPGNNDEHDIADLLDVFRGLHQSTGTWTARERRLPLTNGNLLDVLCKKADDSIALSDWGGEPLLVVVEIAQPQKGLLSAPDCLLLDMPGLDSSIGGIEANKNYDPLLKECDMVLFIQSSVAPLNREALKSLEKMLPERSTGTFWAILNRMESRPWRDKQNKSEDMDTQKKNAETVLEYLGCRKDQTRHVNLGMAFDGFFAPLSDLNQEHRFDDGTGTSKENLISHSGFDLLEKALIDARDHDEERAGIRYTHCMDELRRRINDLHTELNNTIRDISQRLAAANEQVAAWAEVQSTIQNILKVEERNIPHINGVDLIQPPPFDSCLDTVKHQTDWINTQMQVKGAELNEFIRHYCDECKDKIIHILQNLKLKDVQTESNELLYHIACEVVDSVINQLMDELGDTDSKYHTYYRQLDRKRPRGNLADTALNLNFNQDSFNIQTQNKYTENVRKTFRVLNWDLFGWNASKNYPYNPQRPLYDDSINELRDRFRKQIRKELNMHAQAALSRCIKDALAQITARYTTRISELGKECRDKAQHAAAQLELLKNVKKTVDQLTNSTKR